MHCLGDDDDDLDLVLLYFELKVAPDMREEWMLEDLDLERLLLFCLEGEGDREWLLLPPLLYL